MPCCVYDMAYVLVVIICTDKVRLKNILGAA